jgi:hypothetical protein
MPEENAPNPEQPQKKEGQLLGCAFALGGFGLIFLALIFFLRACA